MTTLRSVVSSPLRLHRLGLLALLGLLAVVGLPACEKANDVPRMQDEALATVKDYQARFEELAHRAEAIRTRASGLPAEVLSTGATGQAFRHALSLIEETRRQLQQLPGAIQNAAKSGKPEELAKLADVAHERLERAVIEASSELAAVESAVWIGEQQPAARAAPAGAGEGSEAPIR